MKKAKQNKQQANRADNAKNCGKECGGKCCHESGQYQND